MNTIKEYSPLGDVLDELARKRSVRGPTRVAHFIREQTGDGPNPSAWHQIFAGETKQPTSKNLELFALAFELNHDEMVRVALANTFPALHERGA
jgi:hypothetical protein